MIKHRMVIIDGRWEPSVFTCSIHCSCGAFFTYRVKRKLNKDHRVRCKECGFEVNLSSLIRDWEEREVPIKGREQEVSTRQYQGQKFREF